MLEPTVFEVTEPTFAMDSAYVSAPDVKQKTALKLPLDENAFGSSGWVFSVFNTVCSVVEDFTTDTVTPPYVIVQLPPLVLQDTR